MPLAAALLPRPIVQQRRLRRGLLRSLLPLSSTPRSRPGRRPAATGLPAPRRPPRRPPLRPGLGDRRRRLHHRERPLPAPLPSRELPRRPRPQPRTPAAGAEGVHVQRPPVAACAHRAVPRGPVEGGASGQVPGRGRGVREAEAVAVPHPRQRDERVHAVEERRRGAAAAPVVGDLEDDRPREPSPREDRPLARRLDVPRQERHHVPQRGGEDDGAVVLLGVGGLSGDRAVPRDPPGRTHQPSGDPLVHGVDRRADPLRGPHQRAHGRTHATARRHHQGPDLQLLEDREQPLHVIRVPVRGDDHVEALDPGAPQRRHHPLQPHVPPAPGRSSAVHEDPLPRGHRDEQRVPLTHVDLLDAEPTRRRDGVERGGAEQDEPHQEQKRRGEQSASLHRAPERRRRRSQPA